MYAKRTEQEKKIWLGVWHAIILDCQMTFFKHKYVSKLSVENKSLHVLKTNIIIEKYNFEFQMLINLIWMMYLRYLDELSHHRL